MIHLSQCEHVLPTIETQSVDLVLFDPPFGTTKNKWDKRLDWCSMWNQFKRIVKPSGAIVIFSQMPFTVDLINSNREGYKHYWVWDKKLAGNFAVSKYMPMSISELIVVFTSFGEKVNYYPQMVKGKKRFRGSKNAKTNGQGFGGIEQVYYESDEYFPKNILEFSTVHRTKSLHPSQKPIDLLEYLIKTYSNEGDLVLDPTMGVGSTGKAAKNTNREFIGIEADESYYEIAKDYICSM